MISAESSAERLSKNKTKETGMRESIRMGVVFFLAMLGFLFTLQTQGLQGQGNGQGNGGGPKQGTVTSVAAGPGLAGTPANPITESGTIALDTSFTDGRYVNTAGDTMMGTLNLFNQPPGDVTSGDGVDAPEALFVFGTHGGSTSSPNPTHEGGAGGRIRIFAGDGGFNAFVNNQGGSNAGLVLTGAEGGNSNRGGQGGSVGINGGDGGAASIGNGGAGGSIVLSPGQGGTPQGGGSPGARGVVRVHGTLDIRDGFGFLMKNNDGECAEVKLNSDQNGFVFVPVPCPFP
jgi:hypothetical protein